MRSRFYNTISIFNHRLGPFTQGQLAAFIQAGDTLTMMGVQPGWACGWG